MIPCMGGWCQSRDKCAHHVKGWSENPAERLCPSGEESPEPILRSKNETISSWLRAETHQHVGPLEYVVASWKTAHNDSGITQDQGPASP